MLKKYKNTLPEFFESFGLSGENFNLEENDTQTTIRYKDSSMRFIFIQNKDSFHHFYFGKTSFQPNYPLIQHNSKYLNFEQVKGQFSHWVKNELQEYIFEYEGPDDLKNWIEGSNKFIDIENIDFESNEPFIKSEIKAIKEGLEEAKKLIVEKFDLNDQKQKVLEERIKYLAESTERVSRKTDWKNILIATIINLTITLVLSPDKAKEIWQMFSKIFNDIVQISEAITSMKPPV